MELPNPTDKVATVLLAEDDASLRPYLSAALQQQGFLVLAACNASEALDISRNHPGHVDMLVTDVNLGEELDGVSLAIRLRSRYGELAVLIISGRTEGGESAAAQRFPFLGKPFTLAEFTGRVREVLASWRQRPDQERSAGGGG